MHESSSARQRPSFDGPFARSGDCTFSDCLSFSSTHHLYPPSVLAFLSSLPSLVCSVARSDASISQAWISPNTRRGHSLIVASTISRRKSSTPLLELSHRSRGLSQHVGPTVLARSHHLGGHMDVHVDYHAGILGCHWKAKI